MVGEIFVQQAIELRLVDDAFADCAEIRPIDYIHPRMSLNLRWVGDDQRDPTGPVSVLGVGRFSVEVAQGQSTWSWKLANWLTLLAGLNMALFFFNLIPLLPLDGGHVAGALYEGGRRQVAKARGRPDPGPVDVARMLPLAYTVAFLLISMSVLLIYADVVNPITLN